MTRKIRATVVATLAALALGALPANAAPTGTGNARWAMKGRPGALDMELDRSSGTFSQTSWVDQTWTLRCEAVGFGASRHFDSSGVAIAYWEDLHWTSERSSLTVRSLQSERFPYTVTAADPGTCLTMTEAASANVRAQARARADTLLPMSGPTVGSVAGSDGHYWTTFGEGGLTSDGSLFHSGDARLCIVIGECVEVPMTTITVTGARTS